MWTYEMQWPAPFEGGWKRSSKKFNTIAEAANAAREWLETSAENDVLMEVRLVKIGD